MQEEDDLMEAYGLVRGALLMANADQAILRALQLIRPRPDGEELPAAGRVHQPPPYAPPPSPLNQYQDALQAKIQRIATLRGDGYNDDRIGREYNVTAAAIQAFRKKYGIAKDGTITSPKLVKSQA